MNKENVIKLIMLLAFLGLFLQGSRFKAEAKKVVCIEGKCQKPHDHGELNYHERFHVTEADIYPTAVLKSCANFWEANATGMTFAVIIGAAALSLALSYKKFDSLLQLKGIKGATIGSIIGMPLNMCANCSAVTSMSLTSQKGSSETSLGIIMGGALLNFIGIVTMFGIFSPAVVISRIVFSILMITVAVPFVSKMVAPDVESPIMKPAMLDQITCHFPEKSLPATILKSFEDWMLAVGSIAVKLIPLMLLGTLVTALFRVIFPNSYFEHIESYSPILVIVIISFIATLLSVPVLFEILLGTILLHLGFSNGPIASMVFAAPAFGLFTIVLTRKKLGGLKVPIILLVITFLFAIGAGLLADFLTKFF